MEYYRMRSNSGDSTLQAFQCSPFRECEYENPLLGFHALPEAGPPMDSESSFNLAQYMEERSPRHRDIDLPISEDISQSILGDDSDSGDYYDSLHVIEAIAQIPELTDSHFARLATERPWEHVPIQDINTLHGCYENMFTAKEISQLTLGAYHSLLSFYVHSAVATNEHYRMSHLARCTNTRDLVRFATTLGLVPLVVKLHLEYTNRLEIPIERLLFLVYQRAKHLRLARPCDQSPFAYYRGIELKLGKERDTIIRPLLTSIFRQSREAFKAALLEAGLRYGELRMWKDSQLCTAIHVADTFHPGVWDKAVELHIKKTTKKR